MLCRIFFERVECIIPVFVRIPYFRHLSSYRGKIARIREGQRGNIHRKNLENYVFEVFSRYACKLITFIHPLDF